MSFLLYLLKVTIASGIFFGYYRLFLCNKKFHHYNRFFLVTALALSVALPFIRIPVLFEPENPVHKVVYRTVSVINTDYYEPVMGPSEVETFSEPVFTLMNAIYLLYAIGAVILLTLVTRSLFYIRSIRKKYRAESITSLKFYNTREPGTPFSFFRSIFWNDQLEFNSQEGQQIFRHELFHVQHHHSIDRLLTEIITAVFWFNPFFHLIKRELRAIHEFLADQFAIDTHGSDRYTYATLLVQQALESGKHRVTNHFFQNHIKRRIAMITQFKQSNYGYWSRVMILPVSVLLFCFITLYAKKPAMANTTRFAAVPGKSTNTITDIADGNNEPGLREIIHYNYAPEQDTIPGKSARERQLRQDRERQMQLQQLRQKMMLRETELKKMQQAQLDQLRQQMQSQEKLELEMSELKKMRDQQKEEFLQGLKNRQMILQKERMAADAEMKALMKELESQKDVSPEAEKIRRDKLDELRQKMEDRREAMQDRQKEQEHEMKQKMKEIELINEKLMESGRRQREEMMNMRRKFQERETELRRQHQQNLIRQREQLKQLELEQKQNERNEKQKEDKKQISRLDEMKLRAQVDSLLLSVIRYYNRNLRYPQVAINQQAEGEVYFSVNVDRVGKFRDFKTYQVRPAIGQIQDLVIVGYGPVTVSEPDPKLDKDEIFLNEMKRTTAGRLTTELIGHPDDRTYYFRAVFKIEGKKERENNILLTSNVKVPAKTIYNKPPVQVSEYPLQDTLPRKKVEKVATKEMKPANKTKRVSTKRDEELVNYKLINGEVVVYKTTKVKPGKKPVIISEKLKLPTKQQWEEAAAHKDKEKPAKKAVTAEKPKAPTKMRVEKPRTQEEKPTRIEKEAPRKPRTTEEKDESHSKSNSSSSSSSSSNSNSDS